MIKKLLLIFPLAFFGCIGEDIIQDEIPPEVRLVNVPTSIELGTTFQLSISAFNNIGMNTEIESAVWSSSNEMVLTVDQMGLATAHAIGTSIVTVSGLIDGEMVSESVEIEVGEETVFMDLRDGNIRTTSSYILKGDFEMYMEEGELVIEFFDDYVADDGLPGLYVYLTNNPSTVANAYEIGAVTKFSGAHTYQLSDVDLFDYDYLLYYCKPFNVKVGDGEIMDQ